MTKRKEETTLAEQHLAYKQELTKKLHDEANRRDWCSTFDERMVDAGLLGRGNFYGPNCGDPDCRTCKTRTRIEPVGEDTIEAFEAWKRQAAKKLYQAAETYELGRVDDLAEELDLPKRNELYRTIDVVAEGTFTVSLGEIEVPIEDDLVDHVNRRQVADVVRDALWYDAEGVTWKLRAAK